MKANLFIRIAMGALLVAGAAQRIGAATATVDVASKHQRIRGFGTCSAWNGTLTAEEGVQLWDTLKGAGLSTHRIMIERTGSPDDNEKSNAKLATGYGVKVWGTPWYSKYAVKVNSDYDTLHESNMQAWANDLATMAKAMKAAGTPLYAISPQNESDLGWVKYDAKAMALWVGKYLGPTMAAQAPEVKVMASETCNWYGFSGYEPVLMADPDVKKYTSILATHLYGGQIKAYPEIQAAGKEFWQTEIYDSKTDVEDTGIVSGLRIAGMIHEGLTVANFNAWHFWWIKPCSKCANGALWAEATKRPTKRLWTMGNWSRYVRPGFLRVDVPAQPTSGVSLTAFRDSTLTKIVIVAVNNNTSATSQTFSVPGVSLAKLMPCITDASRDLAVQPTQFLTSNTFSYSLPAQSVTSLVIDVGETIAGATFYQYADFGGLNTKLPVGNYTLAQLQAAGIPDNAVGSMQLDAGLSVELFDGDNFTTTLGAYGSSVADLATIGAASKVTSVRISKGTTSVSPWALSRSQGAQWSHGILSWAGKESGKVQIVSPQGRSMVLELSGGKAATGALPVGIYRARLLGEAGGARQFAVMF